MHNLFLVYLSISTCFWQLWAHYQEKQLRLYDTWYLLFCVDDCLVYRVFTLRTLYTRQSSTQNKYQVSHKHSCFTWWWARSCPKHVEIDKYNKNKLCTELVGFTRSRTLPLESVPPQPSRTSHHLIRAIVSVQIVSLNNVQNCHPVRQLQSAFQLLRSAGLVVLFKGEKTSVIKFL